MIGWAFPSCKFRHIPPDIDPSGNLAGPDPRSACTGLSGRDCHEIKNAKDLAVPFHPLDSYPWAYLHADGAKQHAFA